MLNKLSFILPERERERRKGKRRGEERGGWDRETREEERGREGRMG